MAWRSFASAAWPSRTACSCTGRAPGGPPFGCPTGRSSLHRGRSRRIALGGSVPLVRGPLRLAEAFAVLPAMKRGLPEARLPFERPAVGVALVAASTGATLVRRSSLPVVPREAAVVIASLVPALIALRGRGADLVPRRGARLDRDVRDRRARAEGARALRLPPRRARSRSRQRLPARPPSSSRRATGRPRASWVRSARSERRSRSSAGCRGTPTGGSRVRSPFPGTELQRRLSTSEPSADQLEVAEAALRTVPRGRARRGVSTARDADPTRAARPVDLRPADREDARRLLQRRVLQPHSLGAAARRPSSARRDAALPAAARDARRDGRSARRSSSSARTTGRA